MITFSVLFLLDYKSQVQKPINYLMYLMNELNEFVILLRALSSMQSYFGTMFFSIPLIGVVLLGNLFIKNMLML